MTHETLALFSHCAGLSFPRLGSRAIARNKKSDDDATQPERHRNQLVTFLVGGVLFGFVVALYFEAFSGQDYENPF